MIYEGPITAFMRLPDLIMGRDAASGISALFGTQPMIYKGGD